MREPGNMWGELHPTKAHDEAERDADKTPEQLLKELYQATYHINFNDAKHPAVAQAKFAAMLVVLQREAVVTADKNLQVAGSSLQVSKDILSAHHIVVKLTQQLRSLTWALLIFTAVLLAATFALAWIANSTDRRIELLYRIAEDTRHDEKPNEPAVRK